MPRGRPPVARVLVSCAACGTEFEKRKTDAARNKTGRHFCSRECQFEVGSKPRRRAMRACEWCGENFYPMHGPPEPRFCSRACTNQWQARNRVKKICEVCGTEFWLSPSQAEYVDKGRYHRKARFCSRACMGAGSIKRPLDRMHNGRPAVLDHYGYVKVYEPNHSAPYENWRGWMPEHRVVAEQTLGRELASDEHVHHINGDKADNRPENLLVMSHGEHSAITGLANGQRLKEWEEYRRRYGPL